MEVEQMKLPEDPATPWDGIKPGDVVCFPGSLYNAHTKYVVTAVGPDYLGFQLNIGKDGCTFTYQLDAHAVSQIGIEKV